MSLQGRKVKFFSKMAMYRNIRDLAKDSPGHFRLPSPKGVRLKHETVAHSP